MGDITNTVVLEVKNLKETLYFYEGILGLKSSAQRPQLDVPGVWYDVGSTRICIIVNKKKNGISKGNVTSYLELKLPLCDIEQIQKRLEFYHVPLQELAGRDGGEKRIVVYDPDQYSIQIVSQVKGN